MGRRWPIQRCSSEIGVNDIEEFSNVHNVIAVTVDTTEVTTNSSLEIGVNDVE